MRAFRYVAFILIIALLSACGGGGGATSGKAKVSFKINFDQQSKSAMKNQSRLIVSNTLINSVLIAYGRTGGQQATVDATSAAENSTEITLSDIEVGKPYTFSISAYGADSVLVCEGSGTATIKLNETTDINLTCSFKEKYAVENLAYDLVSKLSSSDGITATELDSMVASDFGIKDGMNRAQFIQNLADTANNQDNRFMFSDDTLIKTEVVAPRTKDAATTTDVKFYFSDGSYTVEPMNFIKEDGVWKITGNGKTLGYEMYPQAVALLETAQQSSPTIYTGYHFGMDHNTSSGISSCTVTGTGVSGAAYQPDSGGYFTLVTPTIDTYFSDVKYNFINVAGLYDNSLSIPSGASYSVTATKSDSSTVTETAIMTGAGITGSELSSAMFPSASVVANSGTYNVTVALPTGFTPAKLDLYAHFDQSTGETGHSVDVDSKISLRNPTFTINVNSLTGGTWTPEYGYVELTAYDSDGRAFTTFLSAAYLGIALADNSNSGGDTGGDTGGGTGGDNGGDNGGVISYIGSLLNPGANTLETASTINFGVNPFIKAILTAYNSDATTTVYSPAFLSNKDDGTVNGFSVFDNNNDSAGNYNTYINAFSYDASSGTLYSKQLVLNDHKTYTGMTTMTGSDGSVYAVAQTYGTGNSTDNEFIMSAIKIDGTTGEIDWAKNYTTPVSSYSFMRGITISADGSSLVVTICNGSGFTLQQINTSDGTAGAGYSYAAADSNIYYECTSLQTDNASGRYALTCITEQGTALLVLNNDFSVAGSEIIAMPDNSSYVSSMVLDDSGNIYMSVYDNTYYYLVKVASGISQQTFSGFSDMSVVKFSSASSTYLNGYVAKLVLSGDAMYVAFQGYPEAMGGQHWLYVNKLTSNLEQVWTLKINMQYDYTSSLGYYDMYALSPAPINSVAVSYYGLLMGIPSNGTTTGLDADVSAGTEDITVAPFSGMTASASSLSTSATDMSFSLSDISLTAGSTVGMYISNFNMKTGDGSMGQSLNSVS